jgi:hypothetical protein
MHNVEFSCRDFSPRQLLKKRLKINIYIYIFDGNVKNRRTLSSKRVKFKIDEAYRPNVYRLLYREGR